MPVYFWLYWGESSGVPLRQVRRVMMDWLKTYQTISEAEAGRIARKRVQQMTDGMPKTHQNRKLVQVYKDILSTAMVPDHADLRYVIEMTLRLPCGAQAPEGHPDAPFNADTESGTLTARRLAMTQLAALPDTLWEWARALMIINMVQYEALQPEYARAPTRQKLYRPYGESDWLRGAAFHLITTLGLAVLPGWATSGNLPADLNPACWQRGEVWARVVGAWQPSILYLPNGTHPQHRVTQIAFYRSQ